MPARGRQRHAADAERRDPSSVCAFSFLMLGTFMIMTTHTQRLHRDEVPACEAQLEEVEAELDAKLTNRSALVAEVEAATRSCCGDDFCDGIETFITCARTQGHVSPPHPCVVPARARNPQSLTQESSCV